MNKRTVFKTEALAFPIPKWHCFNNSGEQHVNVTRIAKRSSRLTSMTWEHFGGFFGVDQGINGQLYCIKTLKYVWKCLLSGEKIIMDRSVEIIVQYFNVKGCLRGINHRVCKNTTKQDFRFWYYNIDGLKYRVYLWSYLEACYDMHYLLWRRYAVVLHVSSSHDTYRPLCQCK